MDRSDLIDRIYEAALLPVIWPTVLEEIGAATCGNGGFMFGVRDGYLSATSSIAHSETAKSFMNDAWSRRDLALKRAMALDHPGFLIDGDMLSESEIATDEVYQHFYRPNGIGYRAGTLIPIPNGDSIAIVIPRHQDNGPVPRETVTYLDHLRPHLARASLTANRLGFERARAQADAMQALGLPCAVLRSAGRICVANELFEALIPALFYDRRDRLVATDSAADALLVEALAALRNEAGIKSIPVGAMQRRLPMVLHLVPVRGAAHDIFTQAIALVIVTPVDRAAVPTAEVLQGLFDLTPAEAKVARGIGKAETIDDLAAAMNVSRETIRSQLKAVLQKTGVARQQQLISLLAGTSFRSTHHLIG